MYNPIFDSQIYQNTAESLILPGFFSGAFPFYYIVFFLNQIWMIDYEFADVQGQGFIPIYESTKLTDALHEVAGSCDGRTEDCFPKPSRNG